MVDEEVVEDEDYIDYPDEAFDKDGKPLSLYAIHQRKSEYTLKALNLAAGDVRQIKAVLVKMAKEGNLGAIKLVGEMWKEQQKERKTTSQMGRSKKISLGFTEEK